MTGYSTICVRVEYRTQMTITPCKTLGSDPNFSCSSSSQQSAPIWAKSDHFTSAENLENAGVFRKINSNPDYTDANVTTSDESSDAMRIFAASPPDNFLHKRFSDHYSSNESLGVKFRSSKCCGFLFKNFFFKENFEFQDPIQTSLTKARIRQTSMKSK